MRVLHFFEKSKFLNSYLQFLKKNYDINDHHFVTWDAKPTYFDLNKELIDEFNLHQISRNNLISAYKAAKLCENYDVIIFHSLFLPINLMLAFSVKRDYLYKTTWVIWGGDLSNYIGNIDTARKLWSVLRNRIINRLGSVVTTKSEYNLLIEGFHVRPARIEAIYPYLAEQVNIVNEVISAHVYNSAHVNILLGNYATRANRHIETLNLLRKFKDYDIRIYIPLSYGDMSYAKEVRVIANEIFGEKAIILTEFMDREEYGKLLSRMRVGIINSNKQLAMGTIYSLLLSGAKIYTDPNGTIWEIIANERGLKIHPVDEIKYSDFDDFVKVDPNEAIENISKATLFLSNENLKEQWDGVFNNKSS